MEICKNEWYSISVDKIKNRVFMEIKGYWKSAQLVPDYLSDIKKAASEVRSGFTLLTDASTFKTPPEDVSQVLAESQKFFVSKGISKVASIANPSALTKMVADKLTRTSGMNRRAFASQDEALKWLDTKE